jgi:hypothetical protein
VIRGFINIYRILPGVTEDYFRVDDNPGVDPSMTTSAFVGTNPTKCRNFRVARDSLRIAGPTLI